MKNAVVKFFAAFVFAAAGAVATTGSASAAPTGCMAQADRTEDVGFSYCNAGSGFHRVVISCQPYVGGVPSIWYGDWTPPNSYSIESCFPWEYITGAGYQLSD